MDGGHLDGLATAAQLIAVLQSCKQLEEAMKARQGGGGAKSGRYMKHDTARLRCLKRVIYPDLCMGKLPSATNAQMLFEMPGPREITGSSPRTSPAWNTPSPRARLSSGPSHTRQEAARTTNRSAENGRIRTELRWN